MITIVDYGIGNIRAFLNIFKRLNIEAGLGSTAADVARAERLILPGVGAFDWAMTKLDGSGLRERLDEAVLGRKVPVLGVCVGMQMMARSSEEGTLQGLGWIPGEVKKLTCPAAEHPARLPHMGWNDVVPSGSHPIFRSFPESPRFYFLHSYYFVPDAAKEVIAECDYSGRFACAVASENAVGVQFHPEKSHEFGIALLENFAKL
jgi:imidazole glycerol-phosphate synthase subunit HisH